MAQSHARSRVATGFPASLHCRATLATERGLPVGDPGERETGSGKRQYVRDIFTAIAPRYDFLNHLLSLNIDRRWRREAVVLLDWQRAPAGSYLDSCAGTLDLAATLGNASGFTGRVIGADFVHPMLVRGAGKSLRVIPVTADAWKLPFGDGHFDGARSDSASESQRSRGGSGNCPCAEAGARWSSSNSHAVLAADARGVLHVLPPHPPAHRPSSCRNIRLVTYLPESV